MTDILNASFEDERRRQEAERERLESRLNIVDDDGDPTPDDMAQIDRGRRLRPDAPPVTRQEADLAIRAYQADRALSVSPRLQRWMAQPSNAAIARDDVEALSFWDYTRGLVASMPGFRATPGSVVERAQRRINDILPFENQVRAIAQGQINIARARLANRLNPETPEAYGFEEATEADRRAFEFLNRIPRERFEGIDAVFEMLPMIGGGLEAGFNGAMRNGANAWRQSVRDVRELNQVGAAAAALNAPFAWAGATVGGGVGGTLRFTYEQEAGAAFEEYSAMVDLEGNPIDPRIAGEMARRVGEVNAFVEFLGLGVAAKLSGADELVQILTRPAARQAIRRMGYRQAAQRLTTGVGGAALAEGFTELTQEGTAIAGGILAQQFNGGEWESLTAEEIGERMWDAFRIGATVGGVLGGIPAGGRFITDIEQIQNAQYQQEVFAALGESAAASRLRERSPGRYADAVNTLTANGPLQTASIDPDRFVALFQDRGQDPFQVADQLQGVGADALRMALETGVDLEIPMGTYATQIAASEIHTELSRHVRLGAGQMTPAEVAASIELGVDLERASSEATRLLAEATERMREGESVRDRLTAMFTDAEAYTARTNARFVEYYASAIETMASRAGMTPSALLDEIGLSIEGPFDALREEGGLEQSRGRGAGERRSERYDPPEGVKLSKRERAYVEMARNNFTNEEIADEWDTSNNAVKVTLNSAKKKLGGAVWEDQIAGTKPGFDTRTGEETASVERMVAIRKELLREGSYKTSEIINIIAERLDVSRAAVDARLRRYDNGGRRDRAGLFQNGEQPIFYSAIERFLLNNTTQRASGAQWWATISRAPGVKKEELEWIGLEDFLKAQEGQIAREDVLAFVRENGVQVEETVLGGGSVDEARQRELLPLLEEQERLYAEKARLRPAAEMQDSRFASAQKARNDARGRITEINHRLEEIEPRIETLQRAPVREGETRWSQYTLPGGSNYRELLLRLPQPDSNTLPQGFRAIRNTNPQRKPDAEWIVIDEPHSRYAHGATEAAAIADYHAKHGAGFRTSHFDQPNILAHVRFNERVDAQGRRTLFIEELQSDWHQAGRERGYQGQEQFTVAKDNGGVWRVRDANGERIDTRDGTIGFATEEAARAAIAEGRMRSNTRAVPNAPFKNNAWASLALKRMIRYASENGFEQIAWTRGQHQLDRGFGVLARNVDQILYKEDGGLLTVMHKANGRPEQFRERDVSQERLRDLIGKDAADLLLAREADNQGYRSLVPSEIASGDITVGAGQRAFYDKIMVNIANDLGKKFGAKVGEAEVWAGHDPEKGSSEVRVRIDTDGEGHVEWDGGERSFETEAEAVAFARSLKEKSETVHSLPITEEMREAALEGQALFQRERARGPSGAIYMPHLIQGGDLRSATIKLFDGRDLSTPLHEGGHLFLEVLQLLAKREGAVQQIVDDWNTTLAWFGVTQEQWDAMTLDQKRPYHEQWARANEAYLMTAEAPSSALRDLFAVFRRWLTWIYKSVLALNVELTPEIKAVMDRMVATDEAIAAIRAQQGYGPRDVTPRDQFSGTDKQYERYVANIGIAREEALADLQKEAMGALIADRTRWWRSEEARARRTVIASMDEEPVWQAYDALSGRKLPEGFDEPIRLSPVIVLAEYGEAALNALPPEIARADVDTLLDQAVTARRTLREREPTRMTARVQQLGGVRDPGGDVKAIIGDARGRPGLINNASGIDPDEMALRLWEEGYFGTPPGRLFQFGGWRAATANMETLNIAQQMERDGVHAGRIWEQTGWARGLDGDWRFEISDADMKTTRPIVQWSRRQKKETKLVEILDWPSLFRAYPNLENVIVEFTDDKTEGGSYWHPARTIFLTRGRGEKAMLSTLRHEIQHAIQRHEGWAEGYNWNDVRRGSKRWKRAVQDHLDRTAFWRRVTRGDVKATQDDIAEAERNAAFDVYANEMGEIEARSVEKRAGMSADQRRATLPTHTPDFYKNARLIWRAPRRDGRAASGPDAGSGGARLEEIVERLRGAKDTRELLEILDGLSATDVRQVAPLYLGSPRQYSNTSYAREAIRDRHVRDAGLRAKAEASDPGSTLPDVPIADPASVLARRVPDEGRAGGTERPNGGSADDSLFQNGPTRRWVAATKDPLTGEIYTGVNHADAISNAPEERWDDLMNDDAANGFLSDGVFLTRAEAHEQMSRAVLPWEDKLLQGERPTVREFLDKLDADVRGTQPAYKVDDEEIVSQREEAERVKEWFARNGVDISAKESSLREQIAKIAAREDTRGVDPEFAASIFGFDSGQELLDALSKIRPRREVIEERTRQRMLQEYGDPFATGEVMDEAMKAAHREAQAKVIELELDAIERAIGANENVAGVSRPVSRAAKDIAETQIERMTVRQIRKHDWFLGNERRHAKEAAKALADGDYYAARLAKHRQLVNFHLYRLARKATEELDRAQQYFRRLETSATVRAKIEPDYLEQIDGLLEQYEFKKITQKEERRRINLAAWARQMEASGLGHLVSIDPRILDDAGRRPYAQMEMDEVRALVDAVKNIEHLGHLKERLLDAADKRAFRETVEELSLRMAETGPLSQQVTQNYSPNSIERAQEGLRRAHAEMTRMEFLFRYLDGGKANGPLWRALWLPFAKAADKESAMMRDATASMEAIWSQNYTTKERARMFKNRIAVPDLPVGAATHYTKAELMAIALNLGNDGNLRALVDGFGWGSQRQGVDKLSDAEYAAARQQIISALSRVLEDRDWQTVQNVWNLIGQYRDEAFSLQKDLTGLEPQAVEATPLQLPSGLMLPGGYYPLKYDRARDLRVERAEAKQDVQEMWGSNWSRPMTRKGHTIERVGSGGRPVKLALSVFAEHVQNVVHDIAYRRAVIDADRIIVDPQFAETFVSVAGRKMYDQLRPWLQAIAADRIDPAAMMWKVLLKLRGNVAIAAMGYRISTGLQQLVGIVQAIPMLGAPEMAGALAKLVRNPRTMADKARVILGKSEFMRSRMQTLDRDIRETIEKMERTDPLHPIRHNAFSLVGMFDWAVSSVVWTAAYDKAMAGNVDGIVAGDEAASVRYGDQAVRTTQSAGLAQDLPAIMRGSEVNKLLTMFFSYFSVLYNWTAYDQVMGARKGRVPLHVFTANMALIYVIAPLIAEALAGRWEPREDEGEEERNLRLASVLVRFPFMTIPVVRDVANVVGTGFEYQLSPVGSAPGQIADALSDVAAGRTFESEATTKRAVVAIGYAFGLPTPQAWIMMDYVADKLEGEEEGFDPVEAFVSDRR